ncbi:MAG: metalloregulator ArsR/SmtB family transcription factor [Nitrospiraceae bacterium]|nr:metalloregulator ArsR/SmtB family transcription factor [Nitrospiraceae bacterium]
MEDDIYSLHAETCKVFSNPVRIRLLELMRDGKWHPVGEMQKTGGYGQANLSQHLSVMRGRGAIYSKKEGRQVFYRISDMRIIRAFDLIRAVISSGAKARGRLLEKGGY